MKTDPLTLVLVEDNPRDAELVVAALEQAGVDFRWRQVDNATDFLAALEPPPEMVLSDYDLPQFSGLEALRLLRQRYPEVPFILISGTIGEDTAVAAMKGGATDYLLKDRLARLGPAVRNALADGKSLRERRKTEEALRLSEERFRLLTETITEVFWIFNADASQVLYVSPGYERTWGRPCAGLYARASDWMEAVHPEDRARLAEAPARRANGSFDEIYRVVQPNGSVRWIHDRTFPYRDVNAQVHRVVGVAVDITAQRLASEELQRREEWFRLLIENATDLIVVVDQAGVVRYHSPSSLRILGYRPEELVGRPVADIIHPDDFGRVREGLQRALSGNQRILPIEYQIRHKDGSLRVLQSHGRPAVGRDGHPLVVVNSRDITDTRHLEEQYRQAQKMEAIGTLAGGIAYDFNNILTAISGYAELAKMEIDNRAAVISHLHAVTEAGRRAAALVRQILSFSRQREQERKPIQLSPVIDEAMKLLRATIPSSIEFHVSLARQAPTVLADPTQIHQLIMNLATNAAHAMRDRPGRLGVVLDVIQVGSDEAERDTGLQPGRYLRLCVSDTGHGMDAATVSRIFDPFFTTKGPGEGTGLGLAVVHGIMQGHDGVVRVFSESGRGSQFYLYFPVHLAEAVEPPSMPEDAPRGSGQRILVVDDEVAIASMEKRILERLGYQVEAMNRPEEALDKFRIAPQAYDVLITDLTMPQMSGTDLAQQVLRIRPDLPILLTTGYIANLTLERVRAMGIAQLLYKPITVQGLAEAVRAAVATQAIRPGMP
ncbi:MAG: PAS domain S-box protein [Opitutaceae bacterium]|nr:PAS domain S-box protein [Opitutaceae bacterium]